MCVGMEPLISYILLGTSVFLNSIKGADGGEYCRATTRTSHITRYCEVGGCCIPGNVRELKDDVDLCCINFITVLLIAIFVGLPVVFILVICILCLVKPCLKKRSRTSEMTPLHGPTNSSRRPKQRVNTRSHTGNEPTVHPVEPPPYSSETRPSLVLPGAISLSLHSQPALLRSPNQQHVHVQQNAPPSFDEVQSGSRDNMDQSQYPSSPPPPYCTRASGLIGSETPDDRASIESVDLAYI